jgi:hypothetical protein
MSDELACRKCGVEITYSGAGRKPSFCEIHRAKKPGDKKPTSRKNHQKLSDSALRMELLSMVQGAGAVVLSIDRFDGSVIISGADGLVDALMSMAASNPSFRAWLEKGSSSLTWVQLALAIGAIVLPIAAHHKIVPMDESQVLALFHPQLVGAAAPAKPQESFTEDERPGAFQE